MQMFNTMNNCKFAVRTNKQLPKTGLEVNLHYSCRKN